MTEEGDLRCRLPTVYVGDRRIGKSKRLVELSRTAVKNGRNIVVVVIGAKFIPYFKDDLGVPRQLIVNSIDQMEKIAKTGVKDITWFVDEWWLQSQRKRIFLFNRSWNHGDEVIGVGTPFPEENIRIREFAQHFEVNPHLSVSENNEHLRCLYGECGE
jgi:hypothetical protein